MDFNIVSVRFTENEVIMFDFLLGKLFLFHALDTKTQEGVNLVPYI